MAQIKFMSTSLRNWPGAKGRIQTYVHENYIKHCMGLRNSARDCRHACTYVYTAMHMLRSWCGTVCSV